MGGWAIAQSPILGITITIERLEKRGYISLSSMYNQMNYLSLYILITVFRCLFLKFIDAENLHDY